MAIGNARHTLIHTAILLQLSACLPPHSGESFPRLGFPVVGDREKPTGGPESIAASPRALPTPGSAGIPDSVTQSPLGAQIISPDPGDLVGTVLAPDASFVGTGLTGLIGNGSATLLALPYRIASLTHLAVADALISLHAIDGKALGTPTTKTNAAGQFTLKAPPNGMTSYFVHAQFAQSGEEFQFSRLISAASASAASADVDAYTTLIDAKLRSAGADRAFEFAKADFGSYLSLVNSVRAALTAENIPVMARAASEDLVPAFDQLVLDDAAVSNAANRFGTAIASPSENWNLKTIFDGTKAKEIGIVPLGDREFSDAGNFEVDGAGNLYLPTFRSLSKAIAIMRVSPTGETRQMTELPASVRNPVQIAFSPTGDLHVVGFALDELALIAYRLGPDGKLIRIPGTLGGAANSILPAEAGRVAIDGKGRVITAIVARHQVVALDPNSGLKIELGARGVAGFVDGPAQTARFSRPIAVTFGNDGSTYVIDAGNNAIRRIDSAFNVRTVSGMSGLAGYRNGRAGKAAFSKPSSLAVDSAGNVFILDAGNFRLRKLSRQGSLFLVAGTGTSAFADGSGRVASLRQPRHLAIDGAGNLYLLDSQNGTQGEQIDVIRVAIRQGSPKGSP